jgi:hypothetical protein
VAKIIFGEDHKLWSPSICSFLVSIYFFSDASILLSARFSTSSAYVLVLASQTKLHDHAKEHNYIIGIFQTGGIEVSNEAGDAVCRNDGLMPNGKANIYRRFGEN